MIFNSYKSCDMKQFECFFSNCIYCLKPTTSSIVVSDNRVSYTVKWLDCHDCGFAARCCDGKPAYIDFFYNLSSAKNINIIADFAGVYLMKWTKVLKIISHTPMTDLNAVKAITYKYATLI